jgi:hypothetical protein
MIFGIACYHSVQYLFSTCMFSDNLEQNGQYYNFACGFYMGKKLGL